MTQQDKGREAFEVIAASEGLRTNIERGDYSYLQTADAWKFWRAARDHYAPKLTKEAAELSIRTAIRDAAGGHSLTNTERDSLWSTKSPVNITMIIEELQSVGIRFKEEA